MAALKLPPHRPNLQLYDVGDVYTACWLDHHGELKIMLQQRGLDIDWVEPTTDTTAAHIVSEKGFDKCLELLLSYGANVYKMDKLGFAPIHAACAHGRYACLGLLANSIMVNLRTAGEEGNTPAMLCCQNGQAKCLGILSDRGADLDFANYDGQTPAHSACQHGQLKCLQLLAKRGADLSKKDGNTTTPLEHARVYRHPECIDFLLSNGVTGRQSDELAPLSEAQRVGLAASFCVVSDFVCVNLIDTTPYHCHCHFNSHRLLIIVRKTQITLVDALLVQKYLLCLEVVWMCFTLNASFSSLTCSHIRK
jgi:hypothetical protein